MNLKEKLKQLLNESAGGITGFNHGVQDKPSLQRSDDARRKKKERQGKQRMNRLKLDEKKSKAKDEVVQPHPREFLANELRLTLSEAFGVYLAEYLSTGKSKYVMEAIKLMEEYPQLKKYVKETSQKHLPKQAFCVYSTRERFDEEIGSVAYRSGSRPHNWYMTAHQAKDNATHLDEHMVMEAKITPDKVLIYVPAFNTLLEKLIFDGKIEEPEVNILRIAKSKNELILPPSVDSGLIVEVKG
jgi:hypothetical protein